MLPLSLAASYNPRRLRSCQVVLPRWLGSRVDEDVRLLIAAFALATVSGQGGGGSPAGAGMSVVPAGTATVSGVVVDGATNAPIDDAIVALSTGTRPLVSQRLELTDARGRFAFTDVGAGSTYAITASKDGYLDGAPGRERSPLAPPSVIAVRDGEWVSDVRVTLWKPGAVSGTIVDEAGEPVAGIYVRVLASIRVQGRDELAAGPLVTTDDRGMYRVAGLIPGRYLVQVPSVQATVPAAVTTVPSGVGSSATMIPLPGIPMDASRLVINRYPVPPPPDGGVRRAYSMVLHPGTRAVSDAGVISLQYGEERTGIDIRLEPVPVFRVSGVVEGPAEALTDVTLRLLASGFDSLPHGSEVATALVAAGGAFTFLNVPAGSYVVDAPRVTADFVLTRQPGASAPDLPLPPGGSAARSVMVTTVGAAPPGTSLVTRNLRPRAGANYVGRMPLTVGTADITNLVFPLQQAGTMRGTIVIDTDPALGTPRIISPGSSIFLETANGTPGLGLLQSDYRPDAPPLEFVIQGLGAGEYVLRGGGSIWMIKSVMWNGRDHTHAPFDAAATPTFSDVVVTLTNRVPVIAGTVRRATGESSAGAAVIAFPADRARWTKYGLRPAHLKSLTADNTGAFRLTGLPAGDYFVVALDRALLSAWQDPAFLASAEAVATRVVVKWGETTAVDLVVREVRK
jgi:hypothetical protein